MRVLQQRIVKIVIIIMMIWIRLKSMKMIITAPLSQRRRLHVDTSTAKLI